MIVRIVVLAILLSSSLSACNVSLLQPVGTIPPQESQTTSASDLDSEVQEVLESLIEQELQARSSGDWEALQALIHPGADPSWREQQQHLLSPSLSGIRLVRLSTDAEWALAAVVETYTAELPGTTETYTTRTFRRAGSDGWKLTSPSLEAWGEEQFLTAGHFHFTYRAFDEPYVRAVAPRMEPILQQMAAGFGLAVPEQEFDVYVASLEPADPHPSAGRLLLAVRSPLYPGFSLEMAPTPEQFLLGYLTDVLGHTLVESAYGESAKEPGRSSLWHTVVQWEAQQAVQRDDTPRLLAWMEGQGVRTPLNSLLNPTATPSTTGGGDQNEAHLFLRFALDTYGRAILAPFLQAVFDTDSAEELVQSVFHQELTMVEQQWRDWLNRSLDTYP